MANQNAKGFKRLVNACFFSEARLGIHINFGISGSFFVEKAFSHNAVGTNMGGVDQYLRHVLMMFVNIWLCSLKVQESRFKVQSAPCVSCLESCYLI